MIGITKAIQKAQGASELASPEDIKGLKLEIDFLSAEQDKTKLMLVQVLEMLKKVAVNDADVRLEIKNMKEKGDHLGFEGDTF